MLQARSFRVAPKMDSLNRGHDQYRASRLPGIPPVSLRILTGAPQAEDPVTEGLQHATNRL